MHCHTRHTVMHSSLPLPLDCNDLFRSRLLLHNPITIIGALLPNMETCPSDIANLMIFDAVDPEDEPALLYQQISTSYLLTPVSGGLLYAAETNCYASLQPASTPISVYYPPEHQTIGTVFSDPTMLPGSFTPVQSYLERPGSAGWLSNKPIRHQC